MAFPSFLRPFSIESNQIIFRMRKNIFSKELEDRQQPNILQLQAQFKECHSASSKQLISSAKRFKTFTSKASKSTHKLSKPLKWDRQNNTCIYNTQEPLSLKLTHELNHQETANSFMNGKSGSTCSALNREGGSRVPLVKQRKKKWMELRDVIMNQKVNGLRDLFCMKVKRNNQFSQPVDYDYEGNASQRTLMNPKGIELRSIQQKIVSILFVYNIVSSIFIFTLSIVFPEVQETLTVRIIEIFGAIIFFLELVLNFITIRFSLGRKLENIKEISSDYFQHKFGIDCINLLVILAYLITDSQILGFFRLVAILKISDCMEKIEKLEVYFIENYYNEQYWSLFKVFLFNFCFAHMLAILLVAMSNLNPDDNWQSSKNLTNAPWFERYIWSYYWGTTIMLTIGFGDMVPVCYQQALCMIFIETISCMVLAYNINCVGSLIANIRSQDIVKSKNMKIFKKLVDKNDISESLTWRINNYIEEHTNIKKLFNIQEEVQFVSKLPTAFRTDYLKEANKTIFQKVFFFNHLMEKTLFSLAEKIEMKIAHPQEIILNVQRNFDVFILKHGEIGYVSRKINRKFNKTVFDRKKILENDAPFLLHANFITKNRSNYGIKSMVYSVLYCLEYDHLIEILKEAHLDYELYCRQRDKNRHNIDEFQVFPCQFCPHQKHTKFSCPKLHFVPIIQHTINRYLFRQKQSKNSRIASFTRIQTPKESSLSHFLYNKQIYNQKKNEAVQIMNKKVKSKKFVIDQLKSLDNETLEPQQYPKNKPLKVSKMEAMTKLQSKIMESTTESIRMQINRLLGVEKAEDDVWLLDLDRMKNYKDYFTENNPCNLIVAFDLEDRIKNAVKRRLFRAVTNIFEKSETMLGLDSMVSGFQDQTFIESSASGFVPESDI